MSKIAMVIRSTAQPGKRGELHELYRRHLAPRAEANDAQEVVVWCADQHDADPFVLFEVYTDVGALGAKEPPCFGEERVETKPFRSTRVRLSAQVRGTDRYEFREGRIASLHVTVDGPDVDT